ncbi:hypothetical protein ACFV6F_16105 [Kitasatospora phosalacinea]|uniref:hypothetical protein n=1 Tax=Kitasatospora phosalacinea TaxID=2065 RepID=UPI0036608DDA
MEAAPTTAAAVDLPVQREVQEQPTSEAQQVLAAYEEALGGPALPNVRAKVLDQAAELLAVRPLWWLIDRVRELPQWGSDLRIHCEKSKVSFTKAAVLQGPENPCPSHPRLEAAGCPQCAADDEVDRRRRAFDAERGIDDASALQALASLIQQAKNPRTPNDRKRDAAARQAAEARRQSAQRAEYLAR